ncbi:aspartyl protease family protein [Fibrella sp. HMF5335]|uniref:Aspartyl protease family protein n=1 Tax=Fibrella rubiginis TaxID=2817060 RepID=A0A939GIL5_9BACT|nr:aspartyl protease family protein [Fibrella rubiginis]MBO0938986.1 aspartyl protease family protein [Fibrella rubiginis]
MKRVGLLLMMLVVWGIAQAGRHSFAPRKDRPDPDVERFGYYLAKGHSVVRLPFELHSNLIILKMRVNDSDTLNFILDTGVSNTIITDPLALRRQPLKLTRQVKLSGVGEGVQLTASVSIDNRLSMGILRAAHQNLVILNDDVLRLSEYVGIPIHGIFGYELFSQFVVTIDFRTRELTLTEPKKYSYKKRFGDRYPILVQNTKPYLDITAQLSGDRTVPLRVVLDTGAGHALMLDGQQRECALPRPEKVIRAQLGRGLNGVINGSLGRIEGLKLGRHQLVDVIASFPDSASFGMKLVNTTDRQGNIGCELLRRFRVTFNYPEQYIVLKPVRSLLRERFEHDMSGLELKARGNDLRTYVIEKIASQSPAELAGLQAGDELLFVNSDLAATLSISDIYKTLQRGEGKEVTMVVRRSGRIVVANFALKRII